MPGGAQAKHHVVRRMNYDGRHQTYLEENPINSGNKFINDYRNHGKNTNHDHCQTQPRGSLANLSNHFMIVYRIHGKTSTGLHSFHYRMVVFGLLYQDSE